MLKIGEFSRLSMLTVKALRFYEKEGLLCPAYVDERSGYRFYEAAQLETAAANRADIVIAMDNALPHMLSKAAPEASRFECEYRATRREELTGLLLAAGCRDVVWK